MMPDHYSYKSDKNYRNRAAKAMDNSIEAQKKAEYYEQKAKALKTTTPYQATIPKRLQS